MKRIAVGVLWSISGAVGSLGLALVTGKVVALAFGPAGVGILGFLRQLRQSAFSLSTLSAQTALVQGGSARRGWQRTRYLQVGAGLVLGATTIVSVGLAVAAEPIAQILFDSSLPDQIQAVRITGGTVFFGSLVFVTNSILMVRRTVGRLFVVQIGSGLAGVGAAVAVVSVSPTLSATNVAIILLAIATTGFVLSSAFSWRIGLCSVVRDGAGGRWAGARNAIATIFSMVGVMVLTATAGTGSLLLARIIIGHSGGTAAVGLFDAAWTITFSSLMVVLAAAQGYVLPTFLRARSVEDAQATMQAVGTLVAIGGFWSVVAIATFSPNILALLFREDFSVAAPLLRWLSVGGLIKSLQWTLTIPLLGRRRMGAWSIVEGTGAVAAVLAALAAGDDVRSFGLWYAFGLAATAIVTAVWAARDGALPSGGTLAQWCLGVGLAATYVASSGMSEVLSIALASAGAVNCFLLLGTLRRGIGFFSYANRQSTGP